MKTILITLLVSAFLTSTVLAKSPDPLQQILDRLEGIEDRLTKMETINKNQIMPPVAPSQKTSSTTHTSTLPSKATNKPITPKKVSPTKYKEGLIVELKPVENDKQLKNPPLESIDAFIWNPENIITNTLIKKKKINVTGTVGFEIRGYLKIEKSGLYTIKITQKIKDVDMWDNFFIRGWIEGNVFVTTTWKSRTDKEGEYTAVGSSQLEPGIYKLRIWIGYKSGENKYKMEKIKIEIKKPGDLKFSSIEKMVYHKIK